MANEKRLIDAMETVIKISKAVTPLVNSGANDEWVCQRIYDKVLSCIADAPTVDAVEVVHGEWINITQLDETHFIGFCSRCGTEQVVKFPTALKAYHKHCRWCGAKMDGGNEYV